MQRTNFTVYMRQIKYLLLLQQEPGVIIVPRVSSGGGHRSGSAAPAAGSKRTLYLLNAQLSGIVGVGVASFSFLTALKINWPMPESSLKV